MFDMSWGEMLIIGGVALVAIGPKDLPKALRTLGQVVGKARRMAGQFQAQFNEAIREANLEELRKDVSDINDAVAPFKSQFDPIKNANEQLQKALGTVETLGLSDPATASGTQEQPQATTASSDVRPEVKEKRLKAQKKVETALLGEEPTPTKKKPSTKPKVVSTQRKPTSAKAGSNTPQKVKAVTDDAAPAKKAKRVVNAKNNSGKKA